MSLTLGSKLGSYEVLSLLGAGGMGEVYRARDTRLGRVVAIKVLPAERMADENRRRRFVQEARGASALSHPNIVTIHEIESADGIDFIVMEYRPGKTLDTVIPRQGTGKKVDGRSDIFSFGAMLYEMVTGRRAFVGNSTAETLAAVLREHPKALSEVVPGVPRDLEKVILRCLQKELGRRFQQMED